MFISVDLPDARRAHDGDELAALDDERHAAQRVDPVSPAVGLRHALDCDDRLRHGLRVRRRTRRPAATPP